jgi:ubiquinone/menaquinone biosynthesis C-methylase UbiE
MFDSIVFASVLLISAHHYSTLVRSGCTLYREVATNWRQQRQNCFLADRSVPYLAMNRRQDGVGYFDKVARRWDAMRQSYFSERVRDLALSEANVQRGKLAADVGAGTGFITTELISQGLRVLAIDESLSMLRVLGSKTLGVADLCRCIGSAERLPIRNCAVDYVFANMCLHHVSNPPAAIGEMARILKKGGTLVITDLDAHAFKFLTQERTDRWMGFKRPDMRVWFARAGLEDVTVSDTGERAQVPSDLTNDCADVSIFMARGEK